MENQFKVKRYIPTLVVEWSESGNQYLVVSSSLYDTMDKAKDAMSYMLKLYDGMDCQVVRHCISCKVFAL